MTQENKILEVSDIGRLSSSGANSLKEGSPDNLSTTGKIFFAAVAAYLAGKIGSGSFLKVRGSPEELRAVAEALAASKAFQDELKRPGATIDSVIEKMNLKRVTADKFEKITGKKFPL